MLLGEAGVRGVRPSVQALSVLWGWHPLCRSTVGRTIWSGGGVGARGPSVRSLIFTLFLKYELLILSTNEVAHTINVECVC